jgi:predicted nucleic acid-binding protein
VAAAPVLIDTTLLIDRERGGERLEQLVGERDRAISVITVSELLHGVHRARGATRVRRQGFVEHLLAAFEPIPITEPVARVHANAWAGLAERGEVIGAHDLWIAATALAYGLDLATDDGRSFDRVPGLTVLSPA